jgi:hypothetical protein
VSLVDRYRDRARDHPAAHHGKNQADYIGTDQKITGVLIARDRFLELLFVVGFLEKYIVVDRLLPFLRGRAGLAQQQASRLYVRRLFAIAVNHAEIDHLVIQCAGCFARVGNSGAVHFAGFAGGKLLQRIPRFVVFGARQANLDHLALFRGFVVEQNDGAHHAGNDVNRFRHMVVQTDLDVIVFVHILQMRFDDRQFIERQNGGTHG